MAAREVRYLVLVSWASCSSKTSIMAAGPMAILYSRTCVTVMFVCYFSICKEKIVEIVLT